MKYSLAVAMIAACLAGGCRSARGPQDCCGCSGGSCPVPAGAGYVDQGSGTYAPSAAPAPGGSGTYAAPPAAPSGSGSR